MKKIGKFYFSFKQTKFTFYNSIPGWGAWLMIRPKWSNDVRFSTFSVERCPISTFWAKRCPISTFWVERCPFSTLFDFTGHCSTLFDFVRLCWPFFNFVWLYRILFDFVRLYRELVEESWTMTTLGHHWTVSVKSPFKNINLGRHKI